MRRGAHYRAVQFGVQIPVASDPLYPEISDGYLASCSTWVVVKQPVLPGNKVISHETAF